MQRGFDLSGDADSLIGFLQHKTTVYLMPAVKGVMSHTEMRGIRELIHSSAESDRIAGIAAIEREIRSDMTEAEIARFANYLRIVIPSLPVYASKALGKLASTGANLTPDFVDFEVKRALEWLHADRIENRRYAAVLVLTELCRSAPRFGLVRI